MRKVWETLKGNNVMTIRTERSTKDGSVLITLDGDEEASKKN